MPNTRDRARIFCATLLFCMSAHATDFDKIVVFGDTLSDAGNLSLRYLTQKEPQFVVRGTTNPGLTTVEYVASTLGFNLQASLLTGGTDYAYGYSGFLGDISIQTLPTQFQTYLSSNGGKADPHTLYQVWAGANDVVQTAYDSSIPNSALTTIAARDEINLLTQMQEAGAKYIVVYNLPDIFRIPAAGDLFPQSHVVLLTNVYNNVLNSGIDQLSQKGLNIIPVNAFQLINEFIARPSVYGFTNVTEPACRNGSDAMLCGPVSINNNVYYFPGTDQTYLYADFTSLTSGANARVAQYVVSIIRAPGFVSLLGEAPLAASAAQTRAIQNQMLADIQGSDTRVFANIEYSHQQFNAQSSSPKTASNNVDLSIGADVRASDHISAGVALGISQHKADSAGSGYKLQDLSGTGYVIYHAGGGYVGGYAYFAHSNFSDIERRIIIGPAQLSESGKADGTRLGQGLTGGWWFDFSNLRTGPFVNVERQLIKIKGYHENGSDSSAMWFDQQQRDALITTLGWRVQSSWQINSTTLSPYAEIAWNHDSKAAARGITAGLNSMPGSFTLTGYDPRKSWSTADIGLSAHLSDNLSGWIGYSGRVGDSSQMYSSVNMGLKYVF
ncbi:autotransporter outer membrane beta-barrel domain-containing protein [Dyella silvatica]|uniref:autotransporter outer membrane beta-barrel domain-containing protein n=1 Tax=Dyella silvatica TaxID=2992128 RepID=UPI0022581ABA|nr:autotransporter domain-containing protein [Dyella silvatica]